MLDPGLSQRKHSSYGHSHIRYLDNMDRKLRMSLELVARQKLNAQQWGQSSEYAPTTGCAFLMYITALRNVLAVL